MNAEEFQKTVYDVGSMLLLIKSMGGADGIRFKVDGGYLRVSATIEPDTVAEIPADESEEE